MLPKRRRRESSRDHDDRELIMAAVELSETEGKGEGQASLIEPADTITSMNPTVAGMAASSGILREELRTMECPVCIEVMIDPVTVMCGHSGCMACFRKCVSMDRSGTTSIKCPFGCQTWIDKRVPAINIFITSRMQLIPEVAFLVRKRRVQMILDEQAEEVNRIHANRNFHLDFTRDDELALQTAAAMAGATPSAFGSRLHSPVDSEVGRRQLYRDRAEQHRRHIRERRRSRSNSESSKDDDGRSRGMCKLRMCFIVLGICIAALICFIVDYRQKNALAEQTKLRQKVEVEKIADRDVMRILMISHLLTEPELPVAPFEAIVTKYLSLNYSLNYQLDTGYRAKYPKQMFYSPGLQDALNHGRSDTYISFLVDHGARISCTFYNQTSYVVFGRVANDYDMCAPQPLYGHLEDNMLLYMMSRWNLTTSSDKDVRIVYERVARHVMDRNFSAFYELAGARWWSYSPSGFHLWGSWGFPVVTAILKIDDAKFFQLMLTRYDLHVTANYEDVDSEYGLDTRIASVLEYTVKLRAWNIFAWLWSTYHRQHPLWKNWCTSRAWTYFKSCMADSTYDYPTARWIWPNNDVRAAANHCGVTSFYIPN